MDIFRPLLSNLNGILQQIFQSIPLGNMANLRDVVACYPTLIAISKRLSATDFASLGCAIGLGKTTRMFSRYSDPLRDMPEYSGWFEDVRTLGCKIILIGRDVKKLFSRINDPEGYDRRNEVDLTIWPAVVPVGQYLHNRDVMRSMRVKKQWMNSVDDFLAYNITLRRFEKSIVVKERDEMAWMEMFVDQAASLYEGPEQDEELYDSGAKTRKCKYSTGIFMLPDNLLETHSIMTGASRWYSPMKPNANNISTVFTLGNGMTSSSIQAEIYLDTYDLSYGEVDKVTCYTAVSDISRLWSANLVDMGREQGALADIVFTVPYWAAGSDAVEESVVYPTEQMSRMGGKYQLEFTSLSGLEVNKPEDGEYTGYGTFKIR